MYRLTLFHFRKMLFLQPVSQVNLNSHFKKHGHNVSKDTSREAPSLTTLGFRICRQAKYFGQEASVAYNHSEKDAGAGSRGGVMFIALKI